MPCSPKATASTSRGPGSEVNISSLCSATALGVSAHVAPCRTCGAAISRRISLTTMVWPAFNTFRAIGPPILPNPMNPMRIRHLHVYRRLLRVKENEQPGHCSMLRFEAHAKNHSRGSDQGYAATSTTSTAASYQMRGLLWKALEWLDRREWQSPEA